jgi:phenylacetate-CoA ligase
MVLLSSEIEKLGKCPFHPKIVFTTGELLNPDDRELINQAFCVKLRDIYGVVEMGDVAWECPALNGYHLNIDSFYAEVFVGDRLAEPGEAGQLVMTNLHSHAMPFIRYEVGDIVTAPQYETCSCGCTFPRLGVLQGRADDWLYTPDKKRVSPLIFVIASIPGVQQYRMIQKDYAHLRVEILPGPGFGDETLRKSADHVIEVMGPGMEVEVVEVSEIPQQAGKMRRVISQIDRSEL